MYLGLILTGLSAYCMQGETGVGGILSTRLADINFLWAIFKWLNKSCDDDIREMRKNQLFQSARMLM